MRITGRERALLAAAAILLSTAVAACDGGTESVSPTEADGTSTTAVQSTSSATTTSTTSASVATTAEVVLPEPRVVDSGLSYVDDGTVLTWAAVIEIPADTPAPATLSYEIDLVDEENRILDSKREFADVVMPGQTAAVTGWFSDPVEGVTALEIRPLLQDPEPTEPAGEWALSDIANEDNNGLVQTTGFVSHTLSTDVEKVTIVNVYYRDGQIVGGDPTIVNRVPSGGEARFVITAMAPLQYDEVKQYVGGYHNPPDTTAASGEGPEPVVVDSGLSYTESGTFVSWAALIEIPADYPTPARLQVDIEFLDAQSRIVDSTRASASVVFPGQTVAATGMHGTQVEGIVVLEATPSFGLPQPDEPVGEWTITDVAHETDMYGPVTTGLISHNFPDDKVNLFVAQVFYRDGQIVGGDSGLVERVPAGEQVQFELRSVDTVEFDTVDVYVCSFQNG